MTQHTAKSEDILTSSIVIDPVTRLEGHVRIEVEITGGRVSKAYSSSTLYRGIEQILIGRDPRDAQHITQRVCGVCTYTHALAATRALEDASAAEVPPLAVQIRNLVLAAQFLNDHIIHFYQLHSLDFVDLESALKADVSQAADILSSRPGNSLLRKSLAEALSSVQQRLKNLLTSGQPGPFAHAYFLGEHPAYQLSPELNLILAKHYLDALAIQAHAARAVAVFGGKQPHPQFTIPGGVTCYGSLTPERIEEFRTLIDATKKFIRTAYFPDVLAISSGYKELATYGGTDSLLAQAEFFTEQGNPAACFFQGGILHKRDLRSFTAFDPDKIAEHIRHSWYTGTEALAPAQGRIDPAYTGLHGENRYSWSKAPRYDGVPMETGPLASLLVNYSQAHPQVCAAVDSFAETIGIKPDLLFSTMGRTAARAMESMLLADRLDGWLDLFQESLGGSGNQAVIALPWDLPKEGEGAGFVGCPRGGLSHWLKIQEHQIAHYQLVVPTTWNLGPRCANDLPGPLEQALVGTPVADPKRPVEILRTVHSFDPCMACAVHVIDPTSNERRIFSLL